MNNRGLTLIELIVAMIIGGIILLAMTCQFVSEVTLRTMINNQVAATHEASLVMHHMARVLRYAQPSTVTVRSTPYTVGSTTYVTSITATIDDSATEGGNLSEFATPKEVTYGRKSDNTVEYKIEGVPVIVISNSITVFSMTNVAPNLTIQLTATYGNKTSSLNTKIRLLGA